MCLIQLNSKPAAAGTVHRSYSGDVGIVHTATELEVSASRVALARDHPGDGRRAPPTPTTECY